MPLLHSIKQIFKLDQLLCRHNYYADDHYFPKYLRCIKCGKRRLYKGKSVE